MLLYRHFFPKGIQSRRGPLPSVVCLLPAGEHLRPLLRGVGCLFPQPLRIPFCRCQPFAGDVLFRARLFCLGQHLLILFPKRRDARTEHLDALAQRLAFRRRIAETRLFLPDLALDLAKIAL